MNRGKLRPRSASGECVPYRPLHLIDTIVALAASALLLAFMHPTS